MKKSILLLIHYIIFGYKSCDLYHGFEEVRMQLREHQ